MMENDLNNQNNNDELLLFAEEKAPQEVVEKEREPWKLLIVDDEVEIHDITKMVLRDFSFQNRELEFLSAYTAHEAEDILKSHDDIAVILLDIVMEHDETGLEIVKFIRESIKNKYVRIILRTGQPGQAPEKEVVENYDINDYKEKTELTSQKLVTSIIASLRSYTGILRIAQLNDQLEDKIRERTAQLEKSIDIIRRDEEAGKKIQFKLLPPAFKQMGDYEFTRLIIPSLYLSGDFLDYFEINDRYLGFYIADVAGHGASSAFITVLLKSFISNCLEQYKAEHWSQILSPAVVLKRMNRILVEDKLDKHLTLFYGLIDKEKKVLKYANGGQFPFPIIFDGRECQYLECKSMPVGLFDFAEFSEHEVALPEEFIMFFVSDGVLEILSEDRLRIQLDILKNLINNFDVSIKGLMDRLRINDFGRYPDDLTFLMIKKTGNEQ